MANIVRTWFGTLDAARFDEYAEYVRQTGVKSLVATPGNEGVLLLKRVTGEAAEIGVLSFWRSREAIAAFAGTDIDKARYYPEDRKYLRELTPELVHYEIVGAEKIDFRS